jgi:hypothetical protein
MNKSAFAILLALLSVPAWAYDSGIAVQTEKGTRMHVYINGKLYNKNPEKFVRVRSGAGLFHIEVKVLNPWNKQWYLVKKDIHTEKGFEFQYRVVFVNKKKPELREVKRNPVYSRYFLNPALYNRHPVS